MRHEKNTYFVWISVFEVWGNNLGSLEAFQGAVRIWLRQGTPLVLRRSRIYIYIYIYVYIYDIHIYIYVYICNICEYVT